MRIALWLARRGVGIVVTLLVVSVLVFTILYLTPGSPEQVLLGTKSSSPELLEAIRARHHLDDPFLVRYWDWLKGVIHLDLGRSIQTNQEVGGILAERLPITIFLAVYAGLIAAAVGVPAGLISGIRNGTSTDRCITLVTTLGISTPAFVMGFLLLYVFGVALGWFPIYGVGDTFVERLRHLTLPAIALALTALAIIARQTRAAAYSVYNQDFTTFARARGLSRRIVLGRYALRNSSLPVVTTTGLILAYFLTGAVLIEQAFAIPGIGTLMVEAVTSKDVTVVQALALVTALFILVANLLADIAHLAIDPRVREAALR